MKTKTKTTTKTTDRHRKYFDQKSSPDTTAHVSLNWIAVICKGMSSLEENV